MELNCASDLTPRPIYFILKFNHTQVVGLHLLPARSLWSYEPQPRKSPEREKKQYGYTTTGLVDLYQIISKVFPFGAFTGSITFLPDGLFHLTAASELVHPLDQGQ